MGHQIRNLTGAENKVLFHAPMHVRSKTHTHYKHSSSQLYRIDIEYSSVVFDILSFYGFREAWQYMCVLA
jgi:hypothetical protein